MKYGCCVWNWTVVEHPLANSISNLNCTIQESLEGKIIDISFLLRRHDRIVIKPFNHYNL